MIYNDRNSVKNMIQYSKQLIKKYKNEISLYDPASQSSLATYSMDTSSSKFFRVTKEIEALPKPDRLQIDAIGFPISLGPGFASALAAFLNREIEAKTGIRDIHKIRGIISEISAVLASLTYMTAFCTHTLLFTCSSEICGCRQKKLISGTKERLVRYG